MFRDENSGWNATELGCSLPVGSFYSQFASLYKLGLVPILYHSLADENHAGGTFIRWLTFLPNEDCTDFQMCYLAFS